MKKKLAILVLMVVSPTVFGMEHDDVQQHRLYCEDSEEIDDDTQDRLSRKARMQVLLEETKCLLKESHELLAMMQRLAKNTKGQSEAITSWGESLYDLSKKIARGKLYSLEELLSEEEDVRDARQQTQRAIRYFHGMMDEQAGEVGESSGDEGDESESSDDGVSKEDDYLDEPGYQNYGNGTHLSAVEQSYREEDEKTGGRYKVGPCPCAVEDCVEWPWSMQRKKEGLGGGAQSYISRRREIAPRIDNVRKHEVAIDKERQQLAERAARPAREEPCKEEMRALHEEVRLLVEEVKLLLGIFRDKGKEAEGEESDLKSWQAYLSKLKQDIKDGKIYSQETLSIDKKNVREAREQARDGIARFAECPIDYEQISYKLLCEKFELAEAINRYIPRVRSLIAKMERLEALGKHMPPGQSVASALETMDQHKKNWEKEIKKMSTYLEKKQFILEDEDGIVKMHEHIKKWHAVIDDSLPIYDAKIAGLERSLKELRQKRMACPIAKTMRRP